MHRQCASIQMQGPVMCFHLAFVGLMRALLAQGC